MSICPILTYQVNEQIVRLTAIITVIALLTAFFLKLPFVFLVLMVDFAARAFVKPSYSPIFILSKKLNSIFKMTPKKINAGPKRFAAAIGFWFLVVINLLFLANSAIADVFVLTMLAFAILEASFGFCVACKVYPFYAKLAVWSRQIVALF